MSKSQKSKGQYFTPLSIVQEIVKFTLNYIDDQITPYRVLDPATGEGIFTQEVIKHFSKKLKLIHINTVDIDPIVIKEARSRLLPFVDENITVSFSCNNFLTESFLGEKHGIYDLVIGNPPHNAKYSAEEWNIIHNIDQEYIQGKIPSESALFFILKSLLLLKEGGILAFILPKPFCYSNRWKSFRNFCLTTFCLLAVFDLANQFSGQLQEQIVIILRKSPSNKDFLTGVWNPENKIVQSLTKTPSSIALQADNFLVSISPKELQIIEKLYSRCEPTEWNAFRGIPSVYRSQRLGTPVIEKVTIAHGFLLPFRSFIKPNTPERMIKRLSCPKIICQRIISYTTQPNFRFFLPAFIDESGEYITHETVINIRPSTIPGINLYSYGALLQSELIRWWLQHVVYTKNFVTSKDLDNPYLQKLVLPKFEHEINKQFRNSLLKNLDMMGYSEFFKEIYNQSKIDQFFAIGELYRLYQREGGQIRNLMDEIRENISPKANIRLNTDFKRIKRLDFLFTRNRITDIKKILEPSLNTEKIIKSLASHYTKMNEIRLLIDQIIFLMYDLSQKEREIIRGGRANK